MQFLDPTNDLAFKKIFGNENKKYILISFLNSILQLPAHEQITEVTLLNPNQAPHLPGAKETILDVRCHDQTGAEYIVEMQVLPEEFFDKRVLYYAAKTYSQQLRTGQKYHQLRPVIFLGILDFKFTTEAHYLSTHCIHNVKTKEHILRDFRFTFAELPKFNKTESELQTVEDKWLFFLKYAKELTAIPEVIREAAIREAFEIVNTLHWDPATLDLYTRRNIGVQVETNRVLYGYNKGLKKGEARGEAKSQRAIARIARTLLAEGVALETVVKCTGLSLDEVKILSEI